MNTIEWVEATFPHEWTRAASAVKGIDQPRARGRWEHLRRYPEYRDECDKIINARMIEAEKKWSKYSSDVARQRAIQEFPGILHCYNDMRRFCSKWDLSLPREDSPPLFLCYLEPFERILHAICTLFLLSGANPARARLMTERWCDDFYSMEDRFLFSFKCSIVGPESASGDCCDTTQSLHIEVLFEGLSLDQRKKFLSRVEQSDLPVFKMIYPQDTNNLVLMVALPGLPFGRHGEDPADRAAPVIEKITTIAQDTIAVKMPAVGPSIENRPKALARQISELDGGGTLGSRVKQQVKAKRKYALTNVKKRAEILNK